MQKHVETSMLDEMLSKQSDIDKQIIRLEQPNQNLLDLNCNFENLITFLGRLSNQIADQQEEIKNVKDKLQSKISQEQLNFVMSHIHQSIEINEQNFLQFLPYGFENSENLYPELISDQVYSILHMIKKKVAMMSKGLMFLYKGQLEQASSIQKMKNLSEDLIDKSSFKEKLEKNENYVNQKILEISNLIKVNNNEFNQQLFQYKSAVQGTQRDLERKTIQKIQDFQDILNTRVNEDYVKSNIKELDEKIQHQLHKIIADKDNQQTQHELKLIRNNIQQLDQNILEKLNHHKDKANQLREQVRVKSLQLDQLQDLTRDIGRKLTQQNENMQNLKVVVSQTQNLLQNQQQLQQQQQQNQQQSQIQQQIQNEEINYQGRNEQHDQNQTNYKNSNTFDDDQNRKQDSESIKEIKQQLDNQDKENKKLMTCIRNIETNILQKIDVMKFQEQIHKTIVLEKQEAVLQMKETIKEVVSVYLPELLQNEEESKKMEKLQAELLMIQDQVDVIMQIEKRMNRLAKDFDINGIIKLIQTKANAIDVTKQNQIFDNKISLLSEQFEIFKSNPGVILNPTSQRIKKKQQLQQKINDLIGKQLPAINTTALIPISCLSCDIDSQNLTSARLVQADVSRVLKSKRSRHQNDDKIRLEQIQQSPESRPFSAKK